MSPKFNHTVHSKTYIIVNNLCDKLNIPHNFVLYILNLSVCCIDDLVLVELETVGQHFKQHSLFLSPEVLNSVLYFKFTILVLHKFLIPIFSLLLQHFKLFIKLRNFDRLIVLLIGGCQQYRMINTIKNCAQIY